MPTYKKRALSDSFFIVCCGERGIRTPGASQLNGFQDRRNRPLCHLSFVEATSFSDVFWGDFLKSGAKVLLFCDMTKYFFTFFSFFAKFYHLLYTYSFLFANTIKKTYLCRTINP